MAWKTYELAGRRFDVLIQQQEADCGLCCAAMIVNLLGKGKPTSSSIKQLLHKDAYKPSTRDRAGFVQTPLAVAKPKETHSDGTYLASLQGVLREYQINSVVRNGSMHAGIAGATAGKPIISHVTWPNGGGHWVVITHSSGMSHYVLDPFYGLRINSSTDYYQGLEKAASGNGVVLQRYGRWTGEYLEIV